MKQLLASDALSADISRVYADMRPSAKRKSGQVYAVFASGEIGGRPDAFMGLIGDREIALLPHRIFADLLDPHPLPPARVDTSLADIKQQLDDSSAEAMPILDYGGHFVGAVTQTSILEALFKQERELLQETQRLNTVLEADRKALALWSARLTELHDALRTLLGILTHTSIEADLLQGAIEALSKLLQARYGAVGIFDADGGLQYFVHTGLSDADVRRIGQAPEGRGLLGVVVREDSVLRLDNIAADPRSAGFPPQHPVMTSLLAVPISHRGRVYGRFYLCDKLGGETFSAEDELLAMNFAHSLSLVLDNAKELEHIKQAQDQLDHLAHFDSLTGLPNRDLLTDRIRQALSSARRCKVTVALLFVDLDHFKNINDSLGHATGDELLKAVATRMKRCVRDGDTVARLGGDEFIILLPALNGATDAATVAQKILQELAPPFRLQGRKIFSSASIGISIFPDDTPEMEDLLRNADTAMYHAKALGRNNYQFFTSALNDSVQKRVYLERLLRQALYNQEFHLVYQPRIDIRNGKMVGVEALLRWNNRELGCVPPSDFIRLAEDTGMIIPIGEWVLRNACMQAKRWADEGPEGLRVSVNLSLRQLQPEFNALVSRILTETGLQPALLEFEISENVMAQDTAVIVAAMQELKTLGICFSIDDFGSGLSSLGYLKRMPVDMLKIDQSFVRDITTDANDAAIVSAITALAENLNLKVIAEGVENEEQVEFLRARSCHMVQGFFFSKPVAAEELTAFWRANRSIALMDG
ncbi:MAG: putative bifunctional diguanylate cyclase/phosphodiesterase [Gammaproteobacteria bacterium]